MVTAETTTEKAERETKEEGRICIRITSKLRYACGVSDRFFSCFCVPHVVTQMEHISAKATVN